MPLVKAIEHGRGQTESLLETLGRCGVWTRLLLIGQIRNPLERGTKEGDSPVGKGPYGDFWDS